MSEPQHTQPKISCRIVPIERLDDVKDHIRDGLVVFDPHQYDLFNLVGGEVIVGTIQRAGHSMHMTPEVTIPCRDSAQIQEVIGRLEAFATSKGLKFKFDSYNDTERLPVNYYRVERA